MTREPSKSRMTCQTEVWKTCVICGDLNKQNLMRSISKAMHLHVMVAYLKFTGSVETTRNFSSYDEHKTYECYVCYEHIDAPAKAIRKIYSFTTDNSPSLGKCDPNRLITVLKQYMPPQYQKLTASELDEAIPNITVPVSRKIQKIDCTCCKVLERTHRRLKTVLENAEETAICVQLNFAVFQELTEIKDDISIDLVKDGVVGVPVENTSLKQQTHERYLMRFEDRTFLKPVSKVVQRRQYGGHFHPNGNKISQMNSQFELIPQKALSIRQVSILPSFPAISFPATPLQNLLSNSATKSDIPDQTYFPIESESSLNLKKRKLMNPLSQQLVQLSNFEHSSAMKSHLGNDYSSNMLEDAITNSPLYSSSGPQEEQCLDFARDVMNTKLVVFSSGDLTILFSESNVDAFQTALSNLESSGLLYSHVTPSGMTIYIKEIRRENLNELWAYGIIPEHYRQRLIGSDCAGAVRGQFEKYKKTLIGMSYKKNVSELNATILSESNNSELEIEFGKFSSGHAAGYNIKKRAPKLEHWDTQ